MTYRAIVEDFFHEDNYDQLSGFSTPQEAFEWAKRRASEIYNKGLASRGIEYWVEDEDVSPIMDDFSGSIT